MMKLWSVVLVALLVLAHADADAKRLGGGKSRGRQSGTVTQREAATPPASPGAPAQNAAKPATSPPAAAAPATKPWGAMLGGLAAGLGLAWLGHSLGLGGLKDGGPCPPRGRGRLRAGLAGCGRKLAAGRAGARAVQPPQRGQRRLPAPLGRQRHGS